MSRDFQIHCLGCGSAKPTRRHQPSCTVVQHHENLYMVDCGEGAQREFARQGLKLSRLNHIFITHLHGDHVFGLFGLMGTLALQSKEGHITIHTFKDGKEIIEKVLNYFSRETPYEIRYNILDPTKEEIALDTGKLRVRTVPLHHKIPCVGYVFEEYPKLRHINREMCDFHGVPVYRMNDLRQGADFEKPDGTIIPNHLLTTDATPSKSYAHMGDTSYFPELASKIGPVDLLYHESTYLNRDEPSAAERGHSTARQAALIARNAGVKKLLLGHYSSRYKDEQEFAKEALEVFPNVVLANEGTVVDV